MKTLIFLSLILSAPLWACQDTQCQTNTIVCNNNLTFTDVLDDNIRIQPNQTIVFKDKQGTTVISSLTQCTIIGQ